MAKEPTTDIYEERCIMVWGVPVISAERLPRLQLVLSKVFGLQKTEYKDEYPLDENNMTKVSLYCSLCWFYG